MIFDIQAKFSIYIFFLDPLKILCFVKKKRDNLHLILNTSAQHNVQITLGEMKYLRGVKNSEKKVGRSEQFSNEQRQPLLATFLCHFKDC